jgi:hypothetical protein
VAPVATMRIQTREEINHEAGRDAFLGPRLDPGLQIMVVYTTPEGTLGALKAADALAKDLNARVGLIVTEVVPFRLPLDQPRVSVEFLKERQDVLVSNAGIESQEIRVQICLCRDRKHTLHRLLPPRSLVVIGGRRNWWSSREQRLETFLARLGHHVVFVDVGTEARTDTRSTLADEQTRSTETRSPGN